MIRDAFVTEAYELCKLDHIEMFQKLNAMETDKLLKLRNLALYPHKDFMIRQMEKAVYVDATAISILKTRGIYG